MSDNCNTIVIQGQMSLEVTNAVASAVVVREGVELVVRHEPLPVDTWLQPWVLEVGIPGTQGPRGASGEGGAASAPKNNRITYDQLGRVTRVEHFDDAALSLPRGSTSLVYDGGTLAFVRHFSAAGALVKTVSLIWQGSTLAGIRQTDH